MSHSVLSLVARQVPEQAQPFASLDHPWYALLEISRSANDTGESSVKTLIDGAP